MTQLEVFLDEKKQNWALDRFRRFCQGLEVFATILDVLQQFGHKMRVWGVN